MKSDFFEAYKHKIKQIDSLIKIKKNNKNKKIILCHGVFDVVHPGHIRHFIYAKSKADILIVSLTSDKFINKGFYRPHVPEKLRALNLAAMEMIDYVYIDNDKKPLKLLKKLKPHFFAKGYEYNRNVNPDTEEEMRIIKSFSGEMIFTPGDLIYSSSKIIESNNLEINKEKLIFLINHNKIKFSNLLKIIDGFKKIKVHIIGDTIVDTYTHGKFIVGQTKTPTFSVLYQGEKNYVGGAAIVAMHLKYAGAKVVFSTMLGKDKLNNFITSNLNKNGIKLNTVLDKNRPTTNKNLIISEGYKLLKVDRLDNSPIKNEQFEKLKSLIKKTNSNIVMLSDFRHGIFNNSNIGDIIKCIPKNCLKVADSQVASRWGNISLFKNFDLITPNEREARFALADQDSSVGSLSGQLYRKTNCKNLILKLGDKGVFCSNFKNIKHNRDHYFSLNSFLDSNKLVDAVGAGDALLAYSSLALKVSNCLTSSAIIGSIAASCACEIEGNKPIGHNLVSEKILDLKKNLDI